MSLVEIRGTFVQKEGDWTWQKTLRNSLSMLVCQTGRGSGVYEVCVAWCDPYNLAGNRRGNDPRNVWSCQINMSYI